MTVLDIALAVVALAVASWTVTVRAALSAVLAFVVYGLLLALIWIRLDAPDVALAEAAIGSGLTGALLIRAAARLRADGGVSPRAPVARASPARALVARASPARALVARASAARALVARASAALLSAIVAGALAVVIWLLPDSAPTLAPAAASNQAATGLGNAVTNVLMAFRAIDTFLEKIVLLLALVAVWSLAPDRAWGGRPNVDVRSDPEGLLPFFARLLAPVGIVIGIYLLWVSADHPGGAFQAGTILAAMWLLVLMARLTETPAIGSRRLRCALIAGPALFLAVGLAGIAWADGFLAYPAEYAKPLILAVELAMLLTIAATLGLLALGPPEQRVDR
ncbi:MAG: DUF4040 domain-containing protein [Hyphomicrobiales bacterium]|nr:DUF4040 domain-containing protein [Hyphomicrobiales bacterium]